MSAGWPSTARISSPGLTLTPISVSGDPEILGLDPLYVANEGKLIAVVAPDSEEVALAALRLHPLGREAVAIGTVVRGSVSMSLT